MTDRRTRAPQRCLERGCPHSGYWESTRGYCPSHYADMIDNLAGAVRRATLPTDE